MVDTFVYDDDCGFCTWCAEQVLEHTDMDVVGFSELEDDQRERLPDDWEEGAHLLTDDAVYSNGEAIEQAFLRADVAPPGTDDVVGFFRQFRDYDRLRERLYREAADRRDVWGLLVSEEPPARRE
ncbi:DCC1-like thiol-disulfide oxidoreductase family protein [Halorarius halobius]|uniref:DCC1-like thiol-disulfide oxidoreductase family protein n=1 Tax=Halorarius halobius TaxID=2962671 RepID=UPI0020CC2843|nr:DCC1-like thiol-disulfide oxidoreductase family protein [Halorarius halobius]